MLTPIAPEVKSSVSQRDRFAVVPGHEADDIEQVVEQNERFYIVDKRDAVEHLVE
jgi:hypothetical protein